MPAAPATTSRPVATISVTARPRVPAATYRFQFHRGFTFNDARELLPYLHALGVSDVYASPFFQAAPGSNHGYDVVDHNKINPEIGSEEEFHAFAQATRALGMGLIADFVPNHMGIGQPTNLWWMDVLENGPSSVYARCFDIDFHPVKDGLENRVLLPILGDQYGRVLENGEFKLTFDEGAFSLHYYDHRLPVNPRSYGQILGFVLEDLGGPATTEGAGTLATAFTPENVHLLELQSILTALNHLPPRTETDGQKIAERAREKEVIKGRLGRLTNIYPEVRESIGRTLARFAGQPGDPRSFDLMDRLIGQQAYRLASWRVAAEEINYRRFFDINELAAIRMEEPVVFDTTHQLLWKLLAQGDVTGLRIDHPDGLYDPRGYFTALQEGFARATGTTLPEDGRGVYLLGEKILVGDEDLRRDWPVHGTTGYDFTVQVTELLVEPAAESAFSRAYREFIDRHVHYPTLVYEKKRLIMRLSLANDVNVLGAMLDRISERNRLTRDFTLNALTSVVREVIACFPVYRTYLVPGQPPTEEDRYVVARAVAAAKRRNPATEASIFDFLRDILLFKFPADLDVEGVREHEAFVMKFQQCTGPIMAKGLEDTAFYIFNRLVALNEVGGEPERFGTATEHFHGQCRRRRAGWPHAMLTTSTHDTKRSEDTRARIAALSELSKDWSENLSEWGQVNAGHKTNVDGEPAPAANEEYLLYQILLGTWPHGGFADGEGGADTLETYVGRVQDYMTKAIKEAKVNSSWIQPNEAWDAAARKFVAALLAGAADRPDKHPFLRTFRPFAARVAVLGALNSLTQTILKFTVPGVPDLYQGNELWDYSLVDPDNRRPVDYAHRQEVLSQLETGGKTADAADLLANWPDGRVKLLVTRALLHARRAAPGLFASGDYRPVRVEGKFSECVVAFVREHEDRSLLVVVPRLSARLGGDTSFPVGTAWADTSLVLDDTTRPHGPQPLRHVFVKDRRLPVAKPDQDGNARLALADLLSHLPLAVFSNGTENDEWPKAR